MWLLLNLGLISHALEIYFYHLLLKRDILGVYQTVDDEVDRAVEDYEEPVQHIFSNVCCWNIIVSQKHSITRYPQTIVSQV